MTTGVRLTNKSKLIPLLFNATLWALIGLSFGWHTGNNGGFHRGVTLTADMFSNMLDARGGTAIELPPKYRDI